MPFVQRRRPEEEGEVQPGLSLDLEERACPACRRFLHPWQETCPDDGTPAVARSELQTMAPPPAHLLDDEAPSDS
jgi:predicted amidophosphoribosyltransferase